ncbi:MAG: sodium-extruding oxaloacetate decarboxylase subunit alpha, partial [Magnetococcales bacterium]|nr:sodium-extruding oxaloacetate decarboxylase subunit alpha [Magnetococcales bacterium]
MAKVNVTETILRDAHQSLIATRMRIDDMLPVCDQLDRIGYWSLEVWGGATFDSCLRFLREDPWERLRMLRRHLPNTRLQMLLRGQNLLGYRHYSDDVVVDFVRRCTSNGIDVFRIFDAMNDMRNLRVAIQAAKESGAHTQGAISYTVSPVHTIEGFVDMAREMAALGCDSVCIKDMAGLLTPFTAATLFASLRQAVDIPLHLHSHATAGLAEMCQLKAIENGCSHIDTALSAFGGGTSHPPTESMVAALKNSPYDSGLDLQKLQTISAHFATIRKKYHEFESEFTGVDTRVQVNQVPGGMISNLADQLKKANAIDRMDEVLAEIPRVREDLGYPPLVTPTSQIVGTQAVLNVLSGQRYKTMTQEVKRYLIGGYGKSPAPVNPEVQQMALGKEDLITCRPADLLPEEMDRLSQEIGPLARSVEDTLTYAMFPEIGRKFLEERNSGNLKPMELAPQPSSNCNERAPVEFNMVLHGETYHVRIDASGHGFRQGTKERHIFLTVDGVPEEVVVDTLSDIHLEEKPSTSNGSGEKTKALKASKPGDVAASMMCDI